MIKVRTSTLKLTLLTGILCSLLILLFLILSSESDLNNNGEEGKNREEMLKRSSLQKLWKRRQEEPSLFPPAWLLANSSVQYVLNNDVCGNDSVLLLVLITSHGANINFRKKIREILSPPEIQSLGIRRLFLLGKLQESQQAEHKKFNNNQEGEGGETRADFYKVQAESEQYRDIVMGDFFESYRNLTFKHLMGLEWATRFCSQAQFLLKQDDDIHVDFYQLKELLTHPRTHLNNSSSSSSIIGLQITSERNNSKFILGKPLRAMSVIRAPSSKWFVTQEEYPGSTYPDFVSGWGYLTTPSAAQDLLAHSRGRLDAGYFWIDDVHVTGTLRERAGIELLDMSSIFTQYKGQLLCCLAPGSLKSRNYQPFWCDFLVGQINDDLELSQSLTSHSRFCSVTRTCVRRSSGEELNQTCVVTNFEQQLRHSSVGRGKAQVIKL